MPEGLSGSYSGGASGPVAHLTASVFSGSTLSHFRQRSSVRPSAAVAAINLFLHFGQRVLSMTFIPGSQILMFGVRIRKIKNC
jgi:hypothetical protein